MNNDLLDNILKTVDLELPDESNMDAYLDAIIPKIKIVSEDISEEKYYLDTRWLEIRDDDDFHEKVLHIFKNDSGADEVESDVTMEYLQSINGNVAKGTWRRLSKSNTVIIEYLRTHELYDLAFLNSNFFVLRKHGNHHQRKYFFLVKESYAGNKEWLALINDLYGVYRGNYSYMAMWAFIIFVGLIFFALTFF